MERRLYFYHTEVIAMQHRNQYDHESSEPGYKAYISNIGWRHKFTVIHEEVDGEERLVKVDKGGHSRVLVETPECARNNLYYRAWMILQNEYQYSGIWTDNRGTTVGFKESPMDRI